MRKLFFLVKGSAIGIAAHFLHLPWVKSPIPALRSGIVQQYFTGIGVASEFFSEAIVLNTDRLQRDGEFVNARYTLLSAGSGDDVDEKSEGKFGSTIAM